MKNTLLGLLIFSWGTIIAQCDLIAPDSLITQPHYDNIFQGDTVTFTTYGGQGDSTSWFALYGEECCVTRLDSNKNGTFTFVVWASDIFYSRIENYCDTTWGASIDVDVWPRLTGISSPDPLAWATLSTSVERDTVPYDLLGRKISGDIREFRGWYIIKKRLFFK